MPYVSSGSRAVSISGLLVSSVLVSACTFAQDTADAIARDQARSFVNAELSARAPGVDVSPVTDCVIDNATAQEIVTIAGGAALGDEATATRAVATVLERPETVQCAARAVLDGALAALL